MSPPSPDLELLRALGSSRENYAAWRPFVKEYAALPEVLPIIEDMGQWFEKHPAPAIDWPSFLAWSRVHQHPSWKLERWDVYKTIVEGAAALPTFSPTIIDRFREMDFAARLRHAAQKALDKGGTPAMSEAQDILAAYSTSASTSAPVTGVASPSLTTMLDGLVRTDGLEWRIEDMNVSVGPLHRGDLVLIGARPEVGKTTFLCGEFTHMVQQLPEGKHAIIFNNEEIANKIRVRLIQSALGTTVADLCMDPAAAELEYARLLGDKRVDVHHDTALATKDVERILKSGEYALIGFNILDKLLGLSAKGDDKEVERLRRLGTWARGIADKYGVVFALAQADASAEGQRLLNQSQLYGTKTGLVAESDAMVMIGKDNTPGMADQRWLNVVRNKMPGGPRTDAAKRHGVFQVEFLGEKARFKSLAYRRPAP